MINPVERTRSVEEVERYKGEPYVIAADTAAGWRGRWAVAGGPGIRVPAVGRIRVWLEDVLGFKLQAERLAIDPAIPSH
jgi:cellobiose phosphorylase